MNRALSANDRACTLLITLLLWMALQINAYRLGLPLAVKRWRGSLRSVVVRWNLLWARTPPEPKRFRRRASNRTPDYVEELLVRLHVEQPPLGSGQLRFLLERLSSWRMARETVRKILLRRKDLVVELQQAKKKTPMRIDIRRPLRLWGADLTLVWVLGFIPVWVLGVVDYCGSHLVVMERVLVPTSAEVQRVLRRAFAEHGVPARILTDNGSQFTSLDFEIMLSAYNVEHTRTLPAHPWTNGRTERLFQTLKGDIFRGRWLVASIRQLDRLLADFSIYYNRDRPHSSYGGRTPDEVYFRRKRPERPLSRVAYFDGALNWYHLG